MPSDHDRYLADRGYGHLIVPESAIEPLTGGAGWHPGHEAYTLNAGSRPMPSRLGCPKCRGVAPGSLRYCPACGASGYETQLDGQRQLMPAPIRDAKPKADALAGGVGKPKRGRPRKVA